MTEPSREAVEAAVNALRFKMVDVPTANQLRPAVAAALSIERKRWEEELREWIRQVFADERIDAALDAAFSEQPDMSGNDEFVPPDSHPDKPAQTEQPERPA